MVNTTAGIMALPAPLENIRLVGDEDKHATLLFFGETSTLPADAKSVLTDSVKQASSMLFPFCESVREITRLGTENPPALVAMISDRCMTQVRNLFLMNPAVKGYLDNTPQFPDFNPHITLSHPDFAQEVILRTLMNQLFRVNFDRLAVWWNDEQIEFPLTQMFEGDSVAMSDAIGDILEHQAIKLGKKNGTKNHVLFIARGGKPKIGDQFSHQGTTHTVISVASSNDGKRHMVTAKPTPKSAMKHFEWESYALEHASTKPWGDYTAADYTPEQYKAACLVVRGDGSSKIMCKLPVRTPDGVLSKPGVHAAAAALAGARSGVILSSQERSSAKKKLQALYNELGDTPPPSIMHALVAFEQATEDDVQQHGVKGQKWGVRRTVNAATGLVSRGHTSTPGEPSLISRTGSADQIHQDRIASKLKSGGLKSVSNADIQSYTKRLQLQTDLKRVLDQQSAAEKAKTDGFIKSFVKSQANRQVDRIAKAAVDIAVEQGLKSAGVKFETSNPALGKSLKEVSTRIKPKKK